MCDHFVYILGPVKGYQNEMSYTVFKKLCYSLKQRKVRQPYYIDPIVLYNWLTFDLHNATESLSKNESKK